MQMYPIHVLLIWYCFGCLSKNPKVVGMLPKVFVYVRNSHTEKRLIDAGCSRVYKIENFFIEKDSDPIVSYDITIALPQLAEHQLCSFTEAKKIHCEIFTALDKSKLSYLVLLHPKMDKIYYKELMSDFHGEIYDGSSHVGLQMGACLINTYSSLVHEAIQEGKDVHIFDPLGFNYSMFDEYSDISYSKNSNELEIFLSNYKEKMNNV